ncbi:MAG TPA: peptide ABC transporter substrate-binding protein [Anaerovoracaceae bacterium]|nr:peptide ABC transporter substrate-binding protein [Anaerovoracaceae bacterium]
MKTKRFLVLSLVFCLVFTLAACGGSGGGGGEETGGGFEMTANIASEPTTIDPALNTAVDGSNMLRHMFEGLMKYKDDGNGNGVLTEGQAASYEISEDGLVYTFKLRDDIAWSDGEPVTAKDFVYAWQRLVTPDTAADYNYIIDAVVNANEIMAGEKDPSELGITAPDDSTVQITLNTPTPYFLEICAFPATFPVRQDMIEQAGDQWTFDPATYIGNGPYKMTEWEHNSYIRMVKNDQYYDYENLGPDSIKYALMDDDNAKLAAYRSGELLYMQNPPIDETPALLASGELVPADYLGTYSVIFNTQKAPFDDPLVREAFSLVIDRNYIVEQITGTAEVPATGYVPNGVSDAAGPGADDFRAVGGDYYSVDPADYEANCDKARDLLAQAGYPGGAGFPIADYMYNTMDLHRSIAEALQNMWQTELGVTVTITNQEWGVFIDTRKNGDFQFARHGWIADYNDPITFLDMYVTDGGNNDAHYKNPEFDAVIAGVKKAETQEERFAGMHEAEDILLADHVMAPIYFYTQPYMMSDKVKGMFAIPLGDFFFMYTSLEE